MIKKIGSAIFYGFSSLMIIFANKIVLTSYKFSSFQALAIGQLVFTLLFIIITKQLKIISIKNFSFKTAQNLLPFAMIYFGNLVFGLGGTKSLNLPMFTVLRRFSVLMTMFGEMFILKAEKSTSIRISIYVMVIGAIIAAVNDLTFEIHGYVFIMLNNLFSAANGIYTKKKLTNTDLKENDLLFYYSSMTLPLLLSLFHYTGEIDKLFAYDGWSNPGFWLFFLLSSLMGFTLNYSMMLCTRFNSPLTTTVIGCLKNILVTYAGMFVGGDYIFSNYNFIGLTLSTTASLFYTYYAFAEKNKQQSHEKQITFKKD